MLGLRARGVSLGCRFLRDLSSYPRTLELNGLWVSAVQGVRVEGFRF